MANDKALPTADRTALEAVLRFASMPEITSTALVEETLAEAAVALGARRFQRLRKHEFPAYARDQAALRGWLDQLLRHHRLRSAARSKLATEIAAWANAATRSDQVIAQGAEIVLVIHVEFDGVQAVIGEVLRRLLANNAAAGSRLLGKCPQCGRYFVRSRVDQETCSGRCRTAKHRELNANTGAIT
jgi:hypothetical protein